MLDSQSGQPEETIHVRARRQCVREYRKPLALAAQRTDPLQDNLRGELHTTSCSDLNPIRGQGRIVAYRHEHANVNQCARGSRIEGQLEDATTARSPQFRTHNDGATRRIENKTHNTIAVSRGILPVYTMANRLGRISTARR